MENIGIIIQARTGSSRLPNKMLLPYYKNMGILELMLSRLIKLKDSIKIIVATSTKIEDDIIEKISNQYGLYSYRGDEENVLKRFIDTAHFYNLKKVIRICADNPLLDIEDLEFQIEQFKNSNFDYWCYVDNDNTPTIKTHFGFWTEAVSVEALLKIQNYTNDKLFLEHVTNFIYTNKNLFNIFYKPIKNEISDQKNIRLTIDTIEDFELNKEIYSKLIEDRININAVDIVNYVKQKQHWKNKMINQINSNSK